MKKILLITLLFLTCVSGANPSLTKVSVVSKKSVSIKNPSRSKQIFAQRSSTPLQNQNRVQNKKVDNTFSLISN